MLRPLLISCLFVAAAQAQAPAAGSVFTFPERISLRDGGFFEAERGVLYAALDRSDPASRVVGVEFYRFPGKRKGPPIFYLHGGPGFRGLTQIGVRGNFEKNWQRYLEIGDVVVVGQRGIGSSKPDTLIEIKYDDPLDRAVTAKEKADSIAKSCAEQKALWEKKGWKLKGFNVLEAANDIDEIRKALKYDKVIIWGGSFGSHWGMAYMRKYPDAVARAILSGLEGPDHTYDHPGHLLKTFQRVAKDAEASERLKSRIPEGGLIKALQATIAKIEKEPVTVTVRGRKIVITYNRIRYLARGYSGGMRTWPSDVIRLIEGDFSVGGDTLLRRSGGRLVMTASFFMLDHGSGITAKRDAEMLADPAVKILGHINWFYRATRKTWGSDLGDAFRQNFECQIPTVLVHGTWDTSTPYENALELAPFFKKGKLVTVKRGSHGAIADAKKHSKPFDEALTEFAKTGDMTKLPAEVEVPVPSWLVPRRRR